MIQRYRLTRLTKSLPFLFCFLLGIFVVRPAWQTFHHPQRLLQKAVEQWDVPLLQKAIERGAVLDTFVNAVRPVYAAMQAKQYRFLQTLAEAGAELNLVTSTGISMAGVALQNADTTALHILGKAGADFTTNADTLGRSLVTHSVAMQKQHLLPLLLEYTDINAHDSNGKPPLHYANDGELAAFLLRTGADPNRTDTNGNTALHLLHAPRALAALTKHGADVNHLNACGVPPIAYHVAEGRYAPYHHLVTAGAAIDFEDSFGNSILFYAAMDAENRLAPYIEKTFLERHPQKWERVKENALKSAIGGALAALASKKVARKAAERAFGIFLKRKGLKKVGGAFVPVIRWIYTALTLKKTIQEAKQLWRMYEAEQQHEQQLKQEVETLRTQLREQHLRCAAL